MALEDNRKLLRQGDMYLKFKQPHITIYEKYNRYNRIRKNI